MLEKPRRRTKPSHNAEKKGKKKMNLFISPHNDDETLFGSFWIQEHRPLVLVVFDSQLQVDRGDPAANARDRRIESIAACNILGSTGVDFCGLLDSDPRLPDKAARLSDALHLVSVAIADKLASIGLARNSIQRVAAPLYEADGHDQHNLVALAAPQLFAGIGPELVAYSTYTRTAGKSGGGKKYVPTGLQIRKKHLALACYPSQMNRTDCSPHFLRSQEEFYS
jgi:LmbE family N-acetylglucosaminyl deacetylase